MTYRPMLTGVFALLFGSVLVGCGAHSTVGKTTSETHGVKGVVHGGQNPVSGATIQLYTVGTTGDGSNAIALLEQTVKSGEDGSFDITDLYSCSNATEVYITATGGYPSPSIANPNLALMTALGPCGSLSSSTTVEINELTTIAAVYAIAPFMTSYQAIGSSGSDGATLSTAFSLAAELVSTSSGTAPGSGIPPSESAPSSLINALGDVIASCVNSAGGTAGTVSLCGQLFTLTTPSGGPAPQNTIQALLNLANNPSMNTVDLFSLISSSPPFPSSITTPPPNFLIRLIPALPSDYVLQVGPSALTFPPTNAFTSAGSQKVVLSNSGSAPISLNSFSIIGENPADFTQSTTCGTTVSASSSCFVSITFTPQALSTRTAYLAVNSSSPNSPQFVQLWGTGASAPASVPHAVVSNPQPYIPYPGASYDVTLSNTGTADLDISSVALATSNDSLTTTCSNSLSPGSSCIASIHANIPTLDQLTFATNDPDLAPLPIQADGELSNPPSLSASNLFFSNTAVSSNSTSQSITFPYNGAAYPMIEGTNAADFVLGPSCSAQGVALYAACTVTVTFTPSASGFRTAVFKFDPSGYYIPLAGYGVVGPPSSSITLSESSANFYDSLTPQTITVMNNGSAAVSIQSVAIQTPLGASEYTQTNNCGTSLGGQSICQITLNSSRRIQGQTQALLSITGDFGTFGVPLSNYLDPFYDFGSSFVPGYVLSALDQVVGPGSASGTLGGADPDDFSIPGCTAGHGSDCSPEITFVPTNAGVRTALATMTNAGSHPSTQTYFLVGTGTTAPVANAIVSGTFQAVGANAPAATGNGSLTIRNSGTTLLQPSAFSINGQSPANFSLASPNSCQAALNADGSTCTTGLIYQSAHYGFSTANLNFTDSGTGQTFSQPLYLMTTVGPPVSPASLSFPDTYKNDVSVPLSVTVTPEYRHPVMATVSAPFQATKSSCAADEVPCVLTFIFAPTATGSFSGNAGVSDPLEGTATSLTLTGNGTVPVIPGVASVSPTFITFPVRSINTESIPVPITVSNTGAGSFTITFMAVDGADPSEFDTSGTCITTVAPGGNCTIDVSFAPTQTGPAAASLVISGDTSAGFPITIPLSGTAQ